MKPEESPGCGKMIDDHKCLDCIWHDEFDKCVIWDCDLITRTQVYDAMSAGLDLKKLIKEALHESH